ncbi:hypothetical protein MMC28_010398 [Mycoblastus sanguinarius]|nr:hypothetical protein [Mycoblastus sanguinarius]
MHHWLSMIGEKNRLRIRHLHLHFSSSQFTDILGNRDEKGRPGELSPVGGDLVADALSFFGNGHNLDTVEVSFQKSTNEDTQPANNRLSGFGRYGYLKEAFLDLFRPGYRNSSLKCALSSIKGVKHLKCEEMVGDLVDTLHGTNLMDEARAGLREVKSMMESGHATRQKQDVSAIWTGRYVDQVEHSLSDPSNLASKLSALDLGGARMA